VLFLSNKSISFTVLNKSKKKRKNTTEAELKKAQKAILTIKNKAKRELYKKKGLSIKRQKSTLFINLRITGFWFFYLSGYLNYYLRP
jgi:hypothetical protein